MMQSSNTYNQAHRLRRLQVRYGDQASYLALLVEWMNGLCHTEDHIQQCWIHRYQSEDEELASELEQEIRHRSRDQEDTTGNMENEPAHEPRGQKTLHSKPSTWYPGEASSSSHPERAAKLRLKYCN